MLNALFAHNEYNKTRMFFTFLSLGPNVFSSKPLDKFRRCASGFGNPQ